MRLMARGYFGRFLAYPTGFEACISRTFLEEEQKAVTLAYGAAGTLLNPLRLWPTHGPVSCLFRRYLTTRSVDAWCKVSRGRVAGCALPTATARHLPSTFPS